MRSAFIGVAALAVLAAGTARAGPWLEAGDRQARSDVELLAAAGVIRGPVNSWPLPWAQIATGLESASTLPPHLAAAARRLQVLSARAERRTRYEARAAVTNEPALIRDFGMSAREEGDVSVRAEHDMGSLSVSYGVGWREGQAGNDVHFEPSHAALALGNWALYAGYVDTWWGPGNDGALLFSTNARPFPKVGIKRLSPEPFDFPVLRWLGPWRFDMFAGLLDEERSDFSNPAVIGMRLSFMPVQGLEIGLNRGLQLCGRNRPCGFKTVSDALIGIGDADNTGTFDEPGNQIAGFDISYTRMIGQVAVKAYAEAEAEDEDNVLVDKFARLAGLTLSGPLGQSGTSWNLGVEFADTLAIKAFGKARYPNIVYNNFIYTQGFTYRRQVIGHSIEGDSKMLSVAASVTDARNRRFYGSVRSADFNRTGRGLNNVSATPEKINIATLGTEWPTAIGDVRFEARFQDDRPGTPGRSPSQAQFELGWRTRF